MTPVEEDVEDDSVGHHVTQPRSAAKPLKAPGQGRRGAAGGRQGNQQQKLRQGAAGNAPGSSRRSSRLAGEDPKAQQQACHWVSTSDAA